MGRNSRKRNTNRIAKELGLNLDEVKVVEMEAPEPVIDPSTGTKFSIISDKCPSLKELQVFVGGRIEGYLTEDATYYFNENGLNLGLPLNIQASQDAGFDLVGNVIKIIGKALEESRA